ncbi:MAG: VCBS repeat-containing protein [Saprospirales bacterium]|nr:VCBS repeat-containing protein [Saprospirales bacterium]
MKRIVLLLLAVPHLMVAQISFTNENALLLNTNVHSGVAIGVVDMNGDGLDDIVRLDQAKVWNIEYQTPGGGLFSNYQYGQVSGGNQWSLCLADFDNNGFHYLFCGGAYTGAKIHQANANGTAYTQSTLPGPGIFVQGSNFADINNDGFVDVFACHDDGESRIWSNNGDGTFSQADNWIDMATSPPSDNSGNYGSIWTDFDNDGDLDLYIAKCRQGVNDPTDPRRINALFVNDGNNNYTEAAGDYNLKIGAQSWTADFNDIDNDGDMDCFITNHDVPSQLLENDGTGVFTDITASSGLFIGGLPIQGVMRDFDNDGFVDILVAGSSQYLYRNNGDKTFTLVPNPFNANDMESYAIGDLNHDGFLDIYGGYAQIYTTPSTIADVLWMNTGNNNNWLAINLVGTESNRNAIGARLAIYGPWGVQIREVRSGESYGIMNSLIQYFGLGAAETLDSLVINWPSGIKETYQPPVVNQYLTIIEDNCISPTASITPDGATTFCSGESVQLTAPEGFNYEWSTGETGQSITVTEAGLYNVTITDDNGCFGIGSGIQITVDPIEMPFVTAQGDTAFCAGGSVILTTEEAAEYLWSTGETTQSITASEGGAYTVTIQGLCAEFTSPAHQVEVYLVDAPMVEPDTITSPGTATLMATGSDPHWYDAQTGGNLLGTGNTYVTPVILETTTFYVEDLGQFGGGTFNGGMPDHTGASLFGGNQFLGELIFDCLEPFTLKQVKVYTDTPGPRVIELRNSNGDVLLSKQVDIPNGPSQIFLDFDVQPGVDLSLTTNSDFNLTTYGFISPRLQRSSSGVMYPYWIEGVAMLKNSNFGEDYYYYFYDWQVVIPGDSCVSARVPVEAVYKDVSALSEIPIASTLNVYPNPSSGTFQVELPVQSQQLRVWSANGQLVLERDLEGISGTHAIDGADWAPGLYRVQVISANGIYRKGVVIGE